MNAFDQIIEQIEKLQSYYTEAGKILEESALDKSSTAFAIMSAQASVTAADLEGLRDWVKSLRSEAEEAPEKPWHDANPGEVWEITYEGERQYALVDEDCDFVISDDVAGAAWMSMRHPAITAGHRVLEAIK